MAVDTGLGAVLTAIPGSWTGATIGIDLHTTTIPTIDTSHLGTTTYREKKVGDLAEAGQVTLRLQFVDTVAPPVVGTVGTLTLTDANQATTGAIWGGTAIIISVNHGSREIDALNTLEVVIEWDGVTGPTFTLAT